jgi:hypothetical protein
MNIRTALMPCAALLVMQSAAAQGVFLPANDVRLREDLSLLADAGVVDLPVNQWPLARQDVAEAVARVDAGDVAEPALGRALARVIAASATPADARDWKLRELRLTAGEPGLLRDYATPGRENGEFTAIGGATTKRLSITLAATGVLDASDGQDVRFDGSDITVRWGNWLFSANQMDRWWGPGYDGNLILSSNARPMPAVSLDRIRSLPVDVPVLRWLGPWRFSAFVGMQQRHRPDLDDSVFLGMRLSFKPARWMEFGLSRTAQFCGEGRPCDLATFGRMVIGQDNAGRRGLDDPADEPGNQLAGFDLRLVSPLRQLPVAVHAQVIGEDYSDTGLPIRYLTQFGAQTWATLDSGTVFRASIEHADTSSRTYKLWQTEDPQPWFNYDYAYRHHIFFAGYRYRGRTIGHTTDADAETTSILLSLTAADGQRWALQARRGRLDRNGSIDPYNPLTAGPSRYKSVQLSWDGSIGRHGIGVQFGHESQWPRSAGDAHGLFGFLQWRLRL